jgi:hypothetical protein
MTSKRAAYKTKRRKTRKKRRDINALSYLMRIICARLQRKYAAEGKVFKWRSITQMDIESVRYINGGRCWDKFPPKTSKEKQR